MFHQCSLSYLNHLTILKFFPWGRNSQKSYGQTAHEDLLWKVGETQLPETRFELSTNNRLLSNASIHKKARGSFPPRESMLVYFTQGGAYMTSVISLRMYHYHDERRNFNAETLQ